MSVTQCLIIAQSFLYAHCAICNQGVCCASFTIRICIQSVVFHTCFLLPHLFHCHCRYLHRGTPPKMSTLHHAERNSKECDTSRRGARGSIFCYIMWTRQENSKLRSTDATSITVGVAFRVQAPNFYCGQQTRSWRSFRTRWPVSRCIKP